MVEEKMGLFITCLRNSRFKPFQSFGTRLAASRYYSNLHDENPCGQSLCNLYPPGENTVFTKSAQGMVVYENENNERHHVFINVKNAKDFEDTLLFGKEPSRVIHLHLNRTVWLNEVPYRIGLLENLQCLNLQGNSIKHIPWSIVYLRKLVKLDLSNNQLVELPRCIGNLVSLEALNLSGNYLISLPTCLLNLTKLNILDVSHNPTLTSPNWETCNKGVTNIMEALSKRSKRKNTWEDFTPWVNQTSLHPNSKTNVKQLFDLCVDNILLYRIDFLSSSGIPPVMKNQLNKNFENFTTFELAKCEDCSGFFSNILQFESHDCRVIKNE